MYTTKHIFIKMFCKLRIVVIEHSLWKFNVNINKSMSLPCMDNDVHPFKKNLPLQKCFLCNQNSAATAIPFSV